MLFRSRSGIELVSPALAGRFFTTEPPEKPLLFLKKALGCYVTVKPGGVGSPAEAGVFASPVACGVSPDSPGQISSGTHESVCLRSLPTLFREIL